MVTCSFSVNLLSILDLEILLIAVKLEIVLHFVSQFVSTVMPQFLEDAVRQITYSIRHISDLP